MYYWIPTSLSTTSTNGLIHKQAFRTHTAVEQQGQSKFNYMLSVSSYGHLVPWTFESLYLHFRHVQLTCNHIFKLFGFLAYNMWGSRICFFKNVHKDWSLFKQWHVTKHHIKPGAWMMWGISFHLHESNRRTNKILYDKANCLLIMSYYLHKPEPW